MSWLVLALAAWAGPSEDPVSHSPRWIELSGRPGDRGTLADGTEVRLTDVHGPDLVRARCPAGVEPTRKVVTEGAIIEGPFSYPVPDGKFWVFDAAPDSFWEFVVTPSDCTLFRLEDEPTAMGLARSEHYGVLVDDGWDPDEQRWIDLAAPDWHDRYLALRPAGPHPNGGVTARPKRVQGGRATTSQRVDAWEDEPHRWHRADPSATWSLQGPRRVVVSARWYGDPHRPCLHIDGTPFCQAPPAWSETVVQEGALQRLDATHDGEALGRTAVWEVALPEGAHDLAIDGPVWVRLAGAWTHLYGELADDPTALVVFPPPDPGPDGRETVHPTGSPSSSLLFGPAARPVRPDEVRWLPLDSPSLAGATLVDEPGVLTLRLQRTGSEPCRVRFAQDSWVATTQETVHRFVWTGEALDATLPSVEGCTAQVRATGLEGAVPDVWLASRWWGLEPGGTLTWEPEAPGGQLWLRHPDTQATSYHVRIIHPSGRREAWEVHPREAPPDRWTRVNEAWQPALRVTLDAGPGPAKLWSDAPLVARVSTLTPEAPVGTPTDPPVEEAPPPDTADTPPSQGPPAHLSAAIADAQGSNERVAALMARAEHLQERYPHLAWRDWERARRLAPDRVDENPLSDTIQRSTARLLFGDGRWVPAGAAWVPEDAPAEALEAATREDWLTVALVLSDAGRDPRPWWREAVVAGQVLTPAQRVRAYRDLTRFTPEAQVDHPALWPLRVLSRWEPVHHVPGARPERVLWPEPPPEPDLFPEPWPAEQTVSARPGFDLLIPRGPVALPVRCLSTRVEDEAEACRFRALDRRGAELARVGTDLWGNPAVLNVPATSEAVYLEVVPAEGVEAQIRLPLDQQPQRDRKAWRLRAGTSARLDLLGPTALSLEAWDPDGDGTVLEVAVRGTHKTQRLELGVQGPQRFLLAIDEPGPNSVTIRASRRTDMVVALRVARATDRPAQDDARLVAAALSTAETLAPDAAAAPPGDFQPPAARPAQKPALTFFSRTGAGTGDPAALDPEDRLIPGGLVLQEIGISSRPGREPLWLDLSVRADAASSAAILSGNGSIEWLPIQRTWRLWILGQAQFVRGLNPDAPLSTLHGNVRFTVDTFPLPHFQIVGRLNLFARTVLSGTWNDDDYGPSLRRLWSDYKDEHRYGATPELELRWRPGPWARGTVAGYVTTNEQIPPWQDNAGLSLFADFWRPALAGRVGGDLQYRFRDTDRSTAFFNPSLFASGSVMAWTGRDLGLQFSLLGQYQIKGSNFTTLGELRLYWSRDRGLDDMRPSRFTAKHPLEWYHDLAADRRLQRDQR